MRGEPKQASGFCVLDNDFAAASSAGRRWRRLRVTAAHEFFHAIQFAYDFTEDPWLLESTATWIEERFADDVNDNRAYLQYGQAARSTTSLDLFDGGGLAHYGNWVFWEFLSEKYGNNIVRTVIAADRHRRRPARRVLHAGLVKVLKSKGGFPSVYAAFAAANTQPRRTMTRAPPSPASSPVRQPSDARGARRADFSTRLNHLTAKTVPSRADVAEVEERGALAHGRRPPRAASPAVALLVVRDDGAVQRRTSSSTARRRSTKVGFYSRKVRSVSVIWPTPRRATGATPARLRLRGPSPRPAPALRRCPRRPCAAEADDSTPQPTGRRPRVRTGRCGVTVAECLPSRSPT